VLTLRTTLLGSILLALLSACATTPIGVDPESLMVRGQVFNAEDGTEVSPATFVQTLREQRHIYVGERHREALSHRSQLDVLELLHSAHIPTAIAVEWLPVSATEALVAYVAGETTEQQMLEEVEWTGYWGHNFDAYRAILQFAQTHRIPIWPLNAPKGMARKVAALQLDSLTEPEKASMTPLTSGNDAHRAYFFKLMAKVRHAHGHGHRKAPSLDAYYRAQLYRDEFMAKSLAEHLTNDVKGRVAVVFAGRAHVAHGLGIPYRAAQLGWPGFSVILPIAKAFSADTRATFGRSAYPKKQADFLWLPTRRVP
jgi:uncharacterized iron-regulated protein